MVATKGDKQVRSNTSVERGFNVTAVCAMNAAGQYAPHFFIFPQKRINPQLLDGAPAGWIGRLSDSGYIDSLYGLAVSFCTQCWVHPRGHRSLFLIDTTPTRTLTLLLQQEARKWCFTLPLHCTHRTLPLVRTLFRSLKAYSFRASDNWITESWKEGR